MLPDLSVLWVIFFVLVLTVLLNRLLFKPLLRVMGEREHAIRRRGSWRSGRPPKRGPRR